MCIGAHPDDVEIGMGGDRRQAGPRRALRVVIVDLTNGEPTPHGTPEKRAARVGRGGARCSACERRTLSQPNRYLFDTVEARTELAEVIREFRPRMLFVPYAEDAHPDHIAASAIAVAARFYAKFTKTDMAGRAVLPASASTATWRCTCASSPSRRSSSTSTEDLPTKLEALACVRVAVLGEPAQRRRHRPDGGSRPRCGARSAASKRASRSSRSSRSRIRSVTDLI